MSDTSDSPGHPCEELADQSADLEVYDGRSGIPESVGRIPLFEHRILCSGKVGLLYAGGHISALSFHPTEKSLCALAAHRRDDNTHNILKCYKGRAHIQLWMLSLRSSYTHCVGVVPHNGNCTWDLKWRPSLTTQPDFTPNRLMGTFVAALGDGTAIVASFQDSHLPHLQPEMLSASTALSAPSPMTLTPKIMTLRAHKKTHQRCPVRVAEWSPDGARLVLGIANGTIEVYETSSSEAVWPRWCIPAQESVITGIRWMTPSYLCSVSMSCVLRLRDMRDPVSSLEQNAESLAGCMAMDVVEPTVAVCGTDNGTLRVVRMGAIDGMLVKQPVKRIYLQTNTIRDIQSVAEDGDIVSLAALRANGGGGGSDASLVAKGAGLENDALADDNTKVKTVPYTLLFAGGSEGVLHECVLPRPIWPNPETCHLPRTETNQKLRWMIALDEEESMGKDLNTDDLPLRLCIGDGKRGKVQTPGKAKAKSIVEATAEMGIGSGPGVAADVEAEGEEGDDMSKGTTGSEVQKVKRRSRAAGRDGLDRENNLPKTVLFGKDLVRRITITKIGLSQLDDIVAVGMDDGVLTWMAMKGDDIKAPFLPKTKGPRGPRAPRAPRGSAPPKPQKVPGRKRGRPRKCPLPVVIPKTDLVTGVGAGEQGNDAEWADQNGVASEANETGRVIRTCGAAPKVVENGENGDGNDNGDGNYDGDDNEDVIEAGRAGESALADGEDSVSKVASLLRKKRGRPRKNDKVAASEETKDGVASEEVGEGGVEMKRKRGRPKKMQKKNGSSVGVGGTVGSGGKPSRRQSGGTQNAVEGRNGGNAIDGAGVQVQGEGGDGRSVPLKLRIKKARASEGRANGGRVRKARTTKRKVLLRLRLKQAIQDVNTNTGVASGSGMSSAAGKQADNAPIALSAGRQNGTGRGGGAVAAGRDGSDKRGRAGRSEGRKKETKTKTKTKMDARGNAGRVEAVGDATEEEEGGGRGVAGMETAVEAAIQQAAVAIREAAYAAMPGRDGAGARMRQDTGSKRHRVADEARANAGWNGGGADMDMELEIQRAHNKAKGDGKGSRRNVAEDRGDAAAGTTENAKTEAGQPGGAEVAFGRAMAEIADAGRGGGGGDSSMGTRDGAGDEVGGHKEERLILRLRLQRSLLDSPLREVADDEMDAMMGAGAATPTVQRKRVTKRTKRAGRGGRRHKAVGAPQEPGAPRAAGGSAGDEVGAVEEIDLDRQDDALQQQQEQEQERQGGGEGVFGGRVEQNVMRLALARSEVEDEDEDALLLGEAVVQTKGKVRRERGSGEAGGDGGGLRAAMDVDAFDGDKYEDEYDEGGDDDDDDDDDDELGRRPARTRRPSWRMRQ